MFIGELPENIRSDLAMSTVCNYLSGWWSASPAIIVTSQINYDGAAAEVTAGKVIFIVYNI